MTVTVRCSHGRSAHNNAEWKTLNDVIVIGGSYAGVAAALQLVRAHRTVTVIDAGKRRNRFASHSHGFLTQDGVAPDEIIRQARVQLLAYPTVTWIDATAAKVVGKIDAFTVTLENNASYDARRLILATGVSDTLPEIPGLEERWGRFVFHCPYCHGYETNKRNLGVLAISSFAVPQALMISEWGPTTLFTNSAFDPDNDQCTLLSAGQIGIEQRRIERISDDEQHVSIHLEDGRSISLTGIFLMPKTSVAGSLAQQLGCEFEDGLTGSYIRVDPMKQTTVEGVYAAGDNAAMAGSITFAVSDGARAGICAHHSLIAGLSAFHAQMSKHK